MSQKQQASGNFDRSGRGTSSRHFAYNSRMDRSQYAWPKNQDSKSNEKDEPVSEVQCVCGRRVKVPKKKDIKSRPFEPSKTRRGKSIDSQASQKSRSGSKKADMGRRKYCDETGCTVGPSDYKKAEADLRKSRAHPKESSAAGKSSESSYMLYPCKSCGVKQRLEEFECVDDDLYSNDSKLSQTKSSVSLQKSKGRRQ